MSASPHHSLFSKSLPSRLFLGALISLGLATASVLLQGTSATAAPVEVGKADVIQDFIRFLRMSGPNAELQTSVTTYRNPQTDQLVSLVGVVHIGDPGYFRRIQQELDSYDLVLYELVGGPAPGSPEDGWVPSH